MMNTTKYHAVTVNPERLASGLWGLPEGDISKSYSGHCYIEHKRAKAPFHHIAKAYVAMSVYSSGFHREATAYPLMNPNTFKAEEYQYSYTGKSISYKGKSYTLGNAVVFSQRPLSLDEKIEMLRRYFAYGGLFAVEAGTYNSYLAGVAQDSDDGELKGAILQEQIEGYMPQSQVNLRKWLEHQESCELIHQQELLF